jgi:hypothetical protein
MAVGRRFRLGGSFRPLSPTEGKFQLKGNGFLAMAGGADFCSGMYQDRSRRRFSGDCEAFSENGGFFRLAE